MSQSIAITDALDRDLAQLLEINNATVPNVNRLSMTELEDLVSKSAATLVARETQVPDAATQSQSAGDAVLGFVLVLTEGCDYKSTNYAWISDRFDRFAYVDRVATAEAARGRGVGRALYQGAFARMRSARSELLCEVNLEPPNPISRSFHAAMGFQEIGQRWETDRAKGVIYLKRVL